MTNPTATGVLDQKLSKRNESDKTTAEDEDASKSVDESYSGESQDEEDLAEKSKKRRNRRLTVVLKDHIVFTPGDPPSYYCSICKKSFQLRSVARYHNYCGAPAEDKPYKCELCDQGFVTSGHYSYHMKSHTGLLPFKCDVCDRSFKQLVKLKRHKQSHAGARPYQCNQCSRYFSAKHVLKEHAYTHSGAKPYSCSVCQKSFNHTSSLRKHKLSHSESFSYTCEDCGKTFKLSWNLTIHKKTHQRERKFICSVCNRAFKLASDLKRHTFTHKEDANIWSCELCNITFRRRDTLTRHTKNLHPPTPESVSNTSEGPKKRGAAAKLSCIAPTPSRTTQASSEAKPVPPVRSHPVPVICSTGRALQSCSSKGNENYVSTITKATHIVRKDESGVPKVHTIVTTTPLEEEIAAGGSVTRPAVLPPDINQQYYRMPDTLAMPGDPSAGRASVLRRSNMGVILYCETSSEPPVRTPELSQGWRPRVIMSNDK